MTHLCHVPVFISDDSVQHRSFSTVDADHQKSFSRIAPNLRINLTVSILVGMLTFPPGSGFFTHMLRVYCGCVSSVSLLGSISLTHVTFFQKCTTMFKCRVHARPKLSASRITFHSHVILSNPEIMRPGGARCSGAPEENNFRDIVSASVNAERCGRGASERRR